MVSGNKEMDSNLQRHVPGLRQAPHDVTGFLIWCVFVAFANGSSIRVSSAVGLGSRQEGETWLLGERYRLCGNEGG